MGSFGPNCDDENAMLVTGDWQKKIRLQVLSPIKNIILVDRKTYQVVSGVWKMFDNNLVYWWEFYKLVFYFLFQDCYSPVCDN